MNIFMYELKLYRKSVTIWSLSIIALLSMFMTFYSSFAVDTAMMDLLLENYPKELLKALGMNSGLSLSSVAGYVAFLFTFVQICLAIQSSFYGFQVLSIEERELTADFLMTKPASRRRIFISKFMAAFAGLLTTTICTGIGTFGSILLFRDGHPFEPGKIFVLLSSIVFFQLFFLSVGMLISVMIKKIRSVLSFSMALAFGLYILSALQKIIGGKILGIITPFNHFEAGYILKQGKYDTVQAAISIGIIIVSLIMSYILYLRRNIHSL
jgi:ABC-2 type transport system permease protein